MRHWKELTVSSWRVNSQADVIAKKNPSAAKELCMYGTVKNYALEQLPFPLVPSGMRNSVSDYQRHSIYCDMMAKDGRRSHAICILQERLAWM